MVRKCDDVVDICKPDMGEEMKKRLCEVICVAPWTSLCLSRETVMSDE